jgi:FkbM family methyltransferase
VELFPGIRADLDFRDATMRTTYWQGERFEKPTAQVLERWATDATHFFDIGSNYGFFSYCLLSRQRSLEVHAFEPNAVTFARVEATRMANDLRRLYAWNIGLGDVIARIPLHPGADDSGHSTFGPHPELGGRSLAEVEVLPFDAWREANRLPIPDRPSWIAKIDVEGFETRVVRGMTESLKARAFIGLAIEINEFTLGFCGSSATELREELRVCGYREEMFAPESGNAFFVPA